MYYHIRVFQEICMYFFHFLVYLILVYVCKVSIFKTIFTLWYVGITKIIYTYVTLMPKIDILFYLAGITFLHFCCCTFVYFFARWNNLLTSCLHPSFIKYKLRGFPQAFKKATSFIKNKFLFWKINLYFCKINDLISSF